MNPTNIARIAVFNEKGGSTKTTTAVGLAVGLGLPLRDLDPQPTATRWLARRESPFPTAAAHDTRWVADCPPGIKGELIPVLASSQLVVVPVRASFPDLETLPQTIRFLRANSRAKIGFLMSAIDGRTSDAKTLLEVLERYSLPILGTFTHRASYRRAGIAGLTPAELDPVAASELKQVLAAIGELQ